MPENQVSPPPCGFEKIHPSQLEKNDLFYMKLAYNQAIDAWNHGEVPVGAVIVKEEEVIASARNQTEANADPTAHAEMIAITQACRSIGDWRLTDARLYVTKEPCPMCAGGIILARIPTVVYGVPDPRRGGAVSVFNILNHPNLNHRCDVVTGIMESECRDILQTFFHGRRKETGRFHDDNEERV